MADWTTLADGLFDPGKPILGSTQIAQRDNYIAITEGATGAPRITLPALENPAPGTTIRARRDAEVTGGGSGSDVVALGFAFIQIGEVRVTLNVAGGTAVFIRRTRDGTATTLATYGTVGAKSLDVSILPGDLVEIVAQGDGASPGRVTLSRIQTAGQNLWPGNSFRLENTYA